MESPSRQLMIVCTAVTGICIGVELVIAIYALDHSLSIFDIPFYANGRVVRRASKDAVLLVPIYMQTMFFFVLAFTSIAWKRFIRTGAERTATFNAKLLTHVDLARGLRLTCYGILGMDTFIFAIVCYYSFQLLNVLHVPA